MQSQKYVLINSDLSKSQGENKRETTLILIQVEESHVSFLT